MRGISGSGKSTYAKKLYNDEIKNLGDRQNISANETKNLNIISICSSDDYFMINGEYKFNYEMLNEAHNSCLRKFLDVVHHSEIRVIIVDNTNTQTWEYAPYSAIAKAFGCELIIVEVQRDILDCINVNQHKVPANSIKAQYERFEPTPKVFTTKIIVIGQLPNRWVRLYRKIFRLI